MLFLAHQSIGFPVDKENQKKSAADSRLIHCLDGFHRRVIRNYLHGKKRKTKPAMPNHACGGFPNKRREGAMLCTSLFSYLLTKAKKFCSYKPWYEQCISLYRLRWDDNGLGRKSRTRWYASLCAACRGSSYDPFFQEEPELDLQFSQGGMQGESIATEELLYPSHRCLKNWMLETCNTISPRLGYSRL